MPNTGLTELKHLRVFKYFYANPNVTMSDQLLQKSETLFTLEACQL